MIPYIIINGVSSKDVKGLLIQSLPPISKPAIRTEIEEIDGRDGDVVTPLGYAAYDKIFSIGVYGDYNIDDIIAFFDTSGVITFSNEIDKYYNFAMYAQIDFEKLIRFKTAEVTIHVQPFKYSAVDNDFKQSAENLIKINNFTITKSGVTLSANDGVISVTGSHSAGVELYIPIEPITLSTGTYELNVSSNTSSNCRLRLIKSNATNADSFGGNYIELSPSASLTETFTAAKTYNYLYLYLEDNTTENFTFTAELNNVTAAGSITLFNRGNVYSRPTLKLKGSGDIELYLNGVQVLLIALGSHEEITIDTVNMNAYNGDTFLNRNVTGNYDNIRLKIGTNTISWSGNVSSIEVLNFSRWI